MGASNKQTRQHTGGMANLAGNVFETHFGIWRVIRALERLSAGEQSRLAPQLRKCDVDDWVEDRKAERHFFQLKHKKKLSWGAVRSEFESQLATRVKGKSVTVALVVRTKLQQKKLRKARGAVAGARVVFFSGAIQPQVVIASAPALTTLRAAFVGDAPTRSDLEAIWSSIDFAWQKVRKPGKFVEVERVLEALTDQNFPPLRHRWRSPPHWNAAEKLLRRVHGLSFSLDGGYFLYDDGSGTRGRYSSRTSVFREFVRRVLKVRPKNLEAVRDIM